MFENVTQGDAVYARNQDGFIGKAIANDTFDKALVAGVAETTESSGSKCKVLVSWDSCNIWFKCRRSIFFISSFCRSNS